MDVQAREMGRAWHWVDWNAVFRGEVVADHLFVRSGLVRKDLLPAFAGPHLPPTQICDSPEQALEVLKRENGMPDGCAEESRDLSTSHNLWVLKLCDSSNAFGMHVIHAASSDNDNLRRQLELAFQKPNLDTVRDPVTAEPQENAATEAVATSAAVSSAEAPATAATTGSATARAPARTGAAVSSAAQTQSHYGGKPAVGSPTSTRPDAAPSPDGWSAPPSTTATDIAHTELPHRLSATARPAYSPPTPPDTDSVRLLQAYVPPLLLDPAAVASSEEPLTVAQPGVDGSAHGHKFHLRALVLVVGNMDVFIHQDMRVLIAPEAMTWPPVDQASAGNLHAHITNRSISKQHPAHEEHLHNRVLREWPTLWNSPHDEAPSTSFDESDVSRQVRLIVQYVFRRLAMQQKKFCPHPNCYELFGFDFLVDQAFKVWILEANPEPSLSMYHCTRTDLLPECPIHTVPDHFDLVYSKALDQTMFLFRKLQQRQQMKQGVEARQAHNTDAAEADTDQGDEQQLPQPQQQQQQQQEASRPSETDANASVATR